MLCTDFVQLRENVRFGRFLRAASSKPELQALARSELNDVAWPQDPPLNLLAVYECPMATAGVLEQKLTALSRDLGMIARDVGLRQRQTGFRGTPDHERKVIDQDSPAVRSIDEFHGKGLGLSKLRGVHVARTSVCISRRTEIIRSHCTVMGYDTDLLCRTGSLKSFLCRRTTSPRKTRAIG